MRVTVVMFCLIGAVFANPILFNAVLESNELDSNSTESVSVSQSSENDTSELQSSEESNSNQSQSSESDSLESTSEDKTSEESNSQSDEDDGMEFMTETRDNSMGSEENVRKSWVQVFAGVSRDLSAEDNSSTEVKGQSDHLTEKQPTHTPTTFRQGTNTNLLLVENPTDSSDTSSDSAGTGEIITTRDSSESTSSESSQTSEASDSSSNASKSSEESNASDSAELEQIKSQDCVNGTQSCESEEYFFQDIGDDAHYSVDNLMVPDEDERELSLRR